MTFPNFFIIGAAKCGTTSLAAWLGDHRDIFLCQPKEPNYFAPDVTSDRSAQTPEAYERLFQGADGAKCVGEASTTYIRSAVAVPSILAAQPDARFIVCLRNPVDMAPSVHGQLIRSGRETIRDFETAWCRSCDGSGEVSDASGHSPKSKHDYKAMCALGTQVKAVLDHVPRERVHFIFLEDMSREPGATYRTALAFLGLDDDGRTDFSVHNTRAVPRSVLVASVISLGTRIKKRLGVSGLGGFGRAVNRLNERGVTKDEKTLSPELKTSLQQTFGPEIQALSRLTGRDLSHWMTG